MPEGVERRLLKSAEAAAYLGVSERTLWTMGRSGDLPRVEVALGARAIVRYDLRDLEAWVESKKQRRARLWGGASRLARGGSWGTRVVRSSRTAG